MDAFLDEDPAIPSIPSFQEHNAVNYPDETSRNDWPLDTRHSTLDTSGSSASAVSE